MTAALSSDVGLSMGLSGTEGREYYNIHLVYIHTNVVKNSRCSSSGLSQLNHWDIRLYYYARSSLC